HIEETPKTLFNFAGVSWMLGRLDYARNALQRYVQLDARNLDAWLLLGNVLVLQNEPSAARTVFRRALALAPGNPAATYGLGWTSLLVGNREEAARLWRPLIPSINNP